MERSCSRKITSVKTEMSDTLHNLQKWASKASKCKDPKKVQHYLEKIQNSVRTSTATIANT